MHSENFTNPNRLDKLFDALTEQTLSKPAEARAQMIERGHDPDAIVSHGMALIERLKGRAELVIAKQKTFQRYEQAKRKILKRLESISDPITYLADLLAQRGETALQTNFRNAKGMSNEDLLDMINEVELLYIFDKLDNDGSSDDK